MKKCLKSRNLFLAIVVFLLLCAVILFLSLSYPQNTPSLYFDIEHGIFAKGYPMLGEKLFTSNYLHVGYFCGFVLSCTAFVVCLTWLLVNVYKQYRQEHPRKPTYKQRVAELEKQIAELKQNQKD